MLEQDEITNKIEKAEERLTCTAKEEDKTSRFIDMAKNYTEITELSRGILLDFIDKIVIYEAEVLSHKEWRQKIEIHYRFLGQLLVSDLSL